MSELPNSKSTSDSLDNIHDNDDWLHYLINMAPTPIAAIDSEGRIIFANEVCCEMLELKEEQFVGKNWFGEFAPQAESDNLPDKIISLIKGELDYHKIEQKIISASGRELHISLRYSLLREEAKGAAVLLTGVYIPDSQREQNMRLQAQKMVAVGQLAGGIAHDFNNLLQGVIGGASMIKHITETDSEIYKTAKIIESASKRAAKLAEQLLGFARLGKLTNEKIDINNLVDEVCALLTRTIDNNITLEKRLYPKPVITEGASGQLQQVIMNLVVNARDAMPEGGSLKIETKYLIRKDGFSSTGTEYKSGRYVRLRIIDNGVGIPPEIQPRLFEPFFTTKQNGKGTGMGLATVFGIVTNHGGHIELDSTPGEGSTFDVYLRAAEEISPTKRQSSTLLSLAKGTGNILIIDDEQTVCEMVGVMLENLGYKHKAKQSPLEGIEYYREHSEEIDGILLDMTMPEMGGKEVYYELKKVNPDVRVTVITGHAVDKDVQNLLNNDHVFALQKPFTVEKLGGALELMFNKY